MSGLECSEIYFNNIHDNLFRLEAEYYKKIYLSIEKKLANYNELGMYVNSINCGPFGSSLLDDKYEINGVLVVRPFNLKQLTIENENLVYISEETLHDNNLKKYGRNTVLFSRVGDIKIGVSNRDNITISPNIIAVSLKNEFLAKYVAVFFYTKYGFLQIKRQLKISAQPTISTNVIEKLKIPFFDKLVDRIISKLDITENLMQQANKAYLKAEQLLVKELNIKIENNSNINIKSFNNSFSNSGRLDAEYYLAKYEALQKNIYKYPKKGNICSIITLQDKNITPKDNKKYKYIELANIDNIGNIIDCTEDFGVNLPTRARRIVHTGDVIVSSIEGSLNKCALITEEFDGAFCSTGFFVIKSGIFTSETLLVLFKSEILQNLMKKGCSGTILTAISKEEFEKICIPILNDNIQQKITCYIKQSKLLYNQSKLLLEAAKKSVEIAIEQNEDIALNYLQEQSDNILNNN
ncbi:Uncharacterised protein [Megamonas hypermegale]|uniref:EcoKI restriction-modification system protein HsdS n=1 Tax=Megamonas hypermegale TaxID=158847 RepID=A0A239TBW6_9FIRM|nr:restriction endonuclease subunit S [Megamonas hypermegale]SNU95230.1 Uncharacterised protein [Megamonas hypermegale]